ncbi:MAG: nitrogenase iron-molybdenum cofactor biosynthesis protein NifE [Deltaproteobacteria bacterium]|nr:nitrogenase iron-molybdenum cofactor biosynthesis protein NifE [Deltaproteobacteria bacterium]MBN2671354.1 nitrogenase iron-molybdenum cofactor biosynthesis protein NifE [Deltaproteobacteria bacterium]
MPAIDILKARQTQVYEKGRDHFTIECNKKSLSGAVSQRACVFCGSRVVLYPVADAVHLVHGPIGCAAYTWDIRGSLSSGPELHRLSFSTDLNEHDIIHGAEQKLERSIRELAAKYKPNAAFVYATCIVGIIGDDVDAVCRKMTKELDIPVIPVHSEGFKGTKRDGYKAACEALFKLVGTAEPEAIEPLSINIMGEFNLAGEAWMIRKYYEKMGINVVSVFTGDGRVNDIKKSHRASLNVVQCSGSMLGLAKMMKEKYGTPFIRVSFFGIEDTSNALYEVAKFFKNDKVYEKTQALVKREVGGIYPKLLEYRKELQGKKAAVYVGGAFKAFSLIQALRVIGIEVVLAGSQTGTPEDYDTLKRLCNEGTIIVDDSNPVELSRFSLEKQADLFIGGVKERPMAMKLGIGFVDHNHERKIALAGYEGMINFAREVHATVTSPVWSFYRKKAWYE